MTASLCRNKIETTINKKNLYINSVSNYANHKHHRAKSKCHDHEIGYKFRHNRSSLDILIDFVLVVLGCKLVEVVYKLVLVVGNLGF